MNSEFAVFEISDHIGIITLDAPPSNQLPVPEFIPMGLFETWTGAPGLKGLIIHGKGKNFSAGGDMVKIFSHSVEPERLAPLLEAGHHLMNAIHALEIPVIAAINRVCFGGGLEVALACHIRVASENALLAFPEVNQNLMPGMGGTWRLPAFAGLAESIRIMLGGDVVDATKAKELGIIDYLAPRDQAFEYSLKLMHRMTHDRPVSVIRAIMQSLKNASVLSQEDAMKEEIRLFCNLARDEAERRKGRMTEPMGLQFDIRQDIGWIILDQPPSNPMTLDFFEEFREHVRKIAVMDDILGIIITGSGRHFSSGAVVDELLDRIDDGIMMDNYRAFYLLEQLEIPVISAIRGVCLGSAMELALFSHYRICTPDAVLGLPESTFNLMPGIGGISRIEMLAGRAKAIELALRGNTYTASDALEMGLADAVVEKHDLRPVAEMLVRSLPAGFRHIERNLLVQYFLKPLLENG